MVVHICCSVDSHYFLSELQKEYPNEHFVGFFYNPNIHPRSEHDLRLSDVRRSCDMLKIPLIEGEYELDAWLDAVRGQEEEPEKGKRCSTCFDVRLEKTAYITKHLGESRFTSTLLSSPMKEQEILYQQGDSIAKAFDLAFIKINVRKNGGVQRQNELAKRDNLYRQNYCGCQFALSQQRAKQGRVSLEMMSELGGRVLPGSIEERAQSFFYRNALECSDKHYILTQKKISAWRLLWGKATYNDVVMPSYILARSESRKLKNSPISWVDVPLQALLDSRPLDSSHIASRLCNITLRMGISRKDDTLCLCLKDFNTLAQAHYQHIFALIYKPICYELELAIRALLCGSESINPIVILDEEREHLSLDIQAAFQEEKIFTPIPLAT